MKIQTNVLSISYVNKLPINLKNLMRVIIIIQKLKGNKVRYHIPQRKLFSTVISYIGKKSQHLHIFVISTLTSPREHRLCVLWYLKTSSSSRLLAYSSSSWMSALFCLFRYSLLLLVLSLFLLLKLWSHNPSWPCAWYVVEDHFDFYLLILLSLLSKC